MNLLKPSVIFILLLLPACEIAGPMAASLGIVGATIAGEALIDREKDNFANRKAWRLQRQMLVQSMTTEMLAEAGDRRRKGNYEGWREIMDEILLFHDKQYPDLLIVQFSKRLNKIEKEKTDGKR